MMARAPGGARAVHGPLKYSLWRRRHRLYFNYIYSNEGVYTPKRFSLNETVAGGQAVRLGDSRGRFCHCGDRGKRSDSMRTLNQS